MITVLGATGFIGSHLVDRLKQLGIEHRAPRKGEELSVKEAGHIIYCIGLTADFRQRPFDTIEAHVCLLNKILSKCEFDSLTYLSSTRVYINCRQKEVFENDEIPVRVNDPSDLYTLSKLAGERLCLSSGKKTKIVRLSNVYGLQDNSENFLTEVIRKVESDKYIKFQTTEYSAKDYIHIDSVTDLLVKIAQSPAEGIFNVASGINTTNNDIIRTLKEHYEFDYEIAAEASDIIFPLINIDRIKNEFSYQPSPVSINLSTQIKNKKHAAN